MRISKLLSFLTCAVVLLVSVTNKSYEVNPVLDLLSVKASADTVSSYKAGDIIKFGWYPQSEVTDAEVISALNEIAGDKKDWTSYDYYLGSDTFTDGKMFPADYMCYKDVNYGSEKYRGVIFDSYRQLNTLSFLSENCQQMNGYIIDTIYWFKYEPIKWRVLDPSTGMVMSETVLDAQAFNNYLLEENIPDPYNDVTYWGDSAKTFYANNYEKSSIREWLNNDFYNTAFSPSQQEIIEYTELDNSAYLISCSAYNSDSVNDKVYLLSCNDVLNADYGFSSSVDDDIARQATGSDYAKCQGLGVSDGISDWRLRTPGVNSAAAYRVDGDGMVYDRYCYTVSTDYGIRPALNLNLESDILQSNVVMSDLIPGEDDEVRPENNKIWIVIIAIIISLVIIAAVLLAFLANKKRKMRMNVDMSFN